MLCLKEVIQETQDTTQTNKEAAEMMMRAVDIASNDLQTSAQVINESVEELITLSPQILAKIEDLPHQLAPAPHPPAATYREILLADPPPSQQTTDTPPQIPHLRLRKRKCRDKRKTTPGGH